MAIAVLMNDALQAQDIWVKAILDGSCLQVMLKGQMPLHQANCVAFIRRGLLRLQPKAINQVVAYGWMVGDTFPLWIAAFSLEQSLLPQKPLHTLASGATEPALEHPLPPTTVPDTNTRPNQTTVQQPIVSLAKSSNTAKQRSELLKLGVVIVLTTAVYFMVTGV
ncbi:hypothetical protein H6F76_23415 [Leptolyngbya sp. FACHB-321]|uniref:hypothetical protein n=1 Tax=Leptolyngbya sp. FACHB-321 TaxID=2692807 RepID=UPI001683608C|nr:hypothetical protein [Leptolyngbya sp. FACHB-321]MBD2037906.1 hypothetical protein [Leptolyngbya sp. FACHB-321]